MENVSSYWVFFTVTQGDSVDFFRFEVGQNEEVVVEKVSALTVQLAVCLTYSALAFTLIVVIPIAKLRRKNIKRVKELNLDKNMIGKYDIE